MNQQLIQIKDLRERTAKADTPELQKKRMEFLGKLQGRAWNYPFFVYELYQSEPEAIKSKPLNTQYLHECKYANTRTKLLSETICEIDKLPLEKAVAIISETCLSLARNNIHFVVFYAEGGRSPYLIIYDFEQLEQLTPFQRIKAQIKFWRKHIPFGLFQYIDTGMFADEHLRPLEFAIHWKHGTPFELLFEYNPFPIPTYEKFIENAKKETMKYKEVSLCKV